MNLKHQTTLTTSFKKSYKRRKSNTRRNHTNVDWTIGCVFCTTLTSFRVAKHRPVIPNAHSLEPMTETDRDETMTETHGDDEEWEVSAVKSKFPTTESHQAKRLPHTKQAVTSHTVIGVEPVLVVQGGRTLAKRQRLGFLHWWTRTNRATPFLLMNEQDDLEHDCVMQGRGGPGSNQRNCRVVEQTGVPRVECQSRQ